MATSTTAAAAARVAGLCCRHNGHMVSMTSVRRCPRLLPAVMGVASRRQPAVWHTCSRRHMHATAAARLATPQQQQQEPDGSPTSGSGSGSSSGTQQAGPVRGWRRLLFWRKQTPEHTGKRFRERGDEMSAQFREELEQVADMEPLAFRLRPSADITNRTLAGAIDLVLAGSAGALVSVAPMLADVMSTRTAAETFLFVTTAFWTLRDGITKEGNRSLGKRLRGVELVHWDGELPSRMACLLRNQYYWLFPLTLYSAIVEDLAFVALAIDASALALTPDRRKLGDWLTGLRAVVEHADRAERLELKTQTEEVHRMEQMVQFIQKRDQRRRADVMKQLKAANLTPEQEEAVWADINAEQADTEANLMSVLNEAQARSEGGRMSYDEALSAVLDDRLEEIGVTPPPMPEIPGEQDLLSMGMIKELKGGRRSGGHVADGEHGSEGSGSSKA